MYTGGIKNTESKDIKDLGTFDMVNFVEDYGKQMSYPDVWTQLDKARYLSLHI